MCVRGVAKVKEGMAGRVRVSVVWLGNCWVWLVSEPMFQKLHEVPFAERQTITIPLVWKEGDRVRPSLERKRETHTTAAAPTGVYITLMSLRNKFFQISCLFHMSTFTIKKIGTIKMFSTSFNAGKILTWAPEWKKKGCRVSRSRRCFPQWTECEGLLGVKAVLYPGKHSVDVTSGRTPPNTWSAGSCEGGGISYVFLTQTRVMRKCILEQTQCASMSYADICSDPGGCGEGFPNNSWHRGREQHCTTVWLTMSLTNQVPYISGQVGKS